jgi:hypothetical protein
MPTTRPRTRNLFLAFRTVRSANDCGVSFKPVFIPIFMLRLEAAARVAAQEAPKYSPRTGAERKTSKERLLLNIGRPAIWKALLNFANT